MSDVIEMHFGDMSTGGADLIAGANKLTQMLADLGTQLDKDTASWSGDNKTQYHAKQAQWNAAANELTMILHKIGNAVTTTGEETLANEQRLAQSWNVWATPTVRPAPVPPLRAVAGAAACPAADRADGQ